MLQNSDAWTIRIEDQSSKFFTPFAEFDERKLEYFKEVSHIGIAVFGLIFIPGVLISRVVAEVLMKGEE